MADLGAKRDNLDSTNISSEQKYRLVFQNSPVGIFQFDKNLMITDCNEKLVDIFLSRKDLLVGLDMHRLNDKALLNVCESAIAGNQGFYEGVYHATTGPAVVSISLKTAPLLSPNGGCVEGGIGIVEDISDRVKAEQELKTKETHFRILSSLTTDAASILGVNPDGSIVREWISDSLLAKMGYSMHDVDSFETWYRIIHPDDLSSYQNAMARIGDGETVSIDFRLVARNGTIVWVNNTVYPEFDSSEKPVRLISALRNITAQKNAEIALNNQKNLLDTVIRVAPVGIWLTAPDGAYVIVNRNFSELVGYGTPNFSLTDEELQVCRANDSLAMNSPEPIEFEGRLTFLDGEQHAVKVYKCKVCDVNGEVIGVLSVLTDITLRQKYEKALVEALEKAEESDRLKSAFLANMSHEIRTPLNGVIGFAKYLRNFPETGREETLKYLNIICNSADHLLNLINDIIDISKIDVGQMTIATEMVNLNALLNEIYSFYYTANPGLAQSGVSFRISTSLSDSESNIIVDKVRLRQVLTNLITNALKFTKEGCVEFGYEVIQNGMMLRFFVNDTGIGIPSDKMDLIFRRFSQADAEITRKYGGTGLGLAISKSLVELMGGTIWVESQVQQGTSFFFTIPYRKVADSLEPREMQVDEASLGDKLKGIRVLIAEDDHSSLLYLKTVLENVGMVCFEAHNGRDAVNVFLKNPTVDIVVMDLKMPEMNGFEAIKAIRAVNPAIPVLVQTAHVFNDEKLLCSALGCENFISKPVDVDLLFVNILQMLKLK
ncbi:MAG: PAS domain S-box protein [Bacteroidales bacterium]|nr:PAS domain S-box protein [Bacteroidales bacterium]